MADVVIVEGFGILGHSGWVSKRRRLSRWFVIRVAEQPQ
jgi:hypothetical protein